MASSAAVRKPNPAQLKARSNMAIVKSSTADAPAAKLSKSFAATAKKHDKELRETVARIEKDYVKTGQLLSTMKQAKEHVPLGFETFELYAQDVLGVGKSQAFESMRIVRELTTGPKALLPSAVSKMTRENAKKVIKLKKSGVKITPSVVKAAQDKTEKRFQEEIVDPALRKKQNIPESEPVMAVKPNPLPKYLAPDAADLLGKAFDVACYVVKDDGEDGPIGDRAAKAIAAEFLSMYLRDYELAKKAEELADK